MKWWHCVHDAFVRVLLSSAGSTHKLWRERITTRRSFRKSSQLLSGVWQCPVIRLLFPDCRMSDWWVWLLVPHGNLSVAPVLSLTLLLVGTHFLTPLYHTVASRDCGSPNSSRPQILATKGGGGGVQGSTIISLKPVIFSLFLSLPQVRTQNYFWRVKICCTRCDKKEKDNSKKDREKERVYTLRLTFC